MNAAITPSLLVYTVALTGGVAAGKSTVGEQFEQLGIHVYDADAAARAVVARGTPALADIITAFGPSVLTSDCQLDRAVMRQRIFDDAGARERLESIVHPRIGAWLRAQVEADQGPYCLLAIPLLAETWPRYAWVDRVLLVRAPQAQRLERLMQRDRMEQDAAQRMLAAQADEGARERLAHDILDNTGDLATLQPAIARLDARYRALATQPR